VPGSIVCETSGSMRAFHPPSVPRGGITGKTGRLLQPPAPPAPRLPWELGMASVPGPKAFITVSHADATAASLRMESASRSEVDLMTELHYLPGHFAHHSHQAECGERLDLGEVRMRLL
jgi:hypothetical protein